MLFSQTKGLLAQDFDAVIASFEELLDNEEMNWVYDDLLELWEHPLDLNTCSDEDMLALPVLSAFEKEALLNYVHRYRPLHSVSELLLVYGWTPLTLQKIKYFVCVKTPETNQKKDWKQALSHGRWQVKQKNQFRLGSITDDSLYLGSRLSNSYQLRYQNNPHLQWGICIDKDEGEVFFDHLGWHLTLKDVGCLKQALLGDYRVHFGQGLIISSGYFGGKSTATQSLLSHTPLFRPHQSWNESAYYRGAAAEIQPQWSGGRMAVFASLQGIDTNLKDSVFSSIKTDGLHRTEKDVLKHNNVQRAVVGMRYQHNHEHWQWGLNALYYRFSACWEPEWQAYNHYYFRGQDGANFSADWRYRWNDWFWSGECAFDHHGHWAAITHLNGKPNERWQILLSLRRFKQAYQAPLAATFSEKSGVSNEEGIFLGGDFLLFKQCQLHCYVDCYRFPWLRYGVNAASHGWDAQCEADWSLGNFVQMKLRYKEKHQQKNMLADLSSPGVRALIEQEKRSLRLQIISEIEDLRLKTQVLWSQMNTDLTESSKSVCLAQDLTKQWKMIPLSLHLQYAVFDNDDGNASYLYSSDLQGNMPYSMLSEKGQLLLCLLKYQCSKAIQCQVRAKHIIYQNKSPTSNIAGLVSFKF